MLNNWQIGILILSIVQILATGFSIYVNCYFIGFAVYISWLSDLLSLAASVMFIIAIFRNLGKRFHFIALIFLYVCEGLSLLVFILFRINYYINYSKIVLLCVITPLIVVVHLYLRKFSILYQYGPSVEQQPYQSQYQTEPINRFTNTSNV